MKMRDIIDIIDLDRMSVGNFCEIFRSIELSTKEDRSKLLQVMYGQDRQDEAEQLDLGKVRAEIAKLNAAAERDRAAVEIED